MPYAIITRDRTDAGSLRADTRAAHLEYLKQFSEQIIAGGGFLTDAGELDGGGLIIVDTEDRQEAERLAENDPYTKAGLFESVEIRRWRKVFVAGQMMV